MSETVSETMSAQLPGIAERTLRVQVAEDGEASLDIFLTDLPSPYLTRITFAGGKGSPSRCTREALERLVRAFNGPRELWAVQQNFDPKEIEVKIPGSHPQTGMTLLAQANDSYTVLITIHGRNAHDQPAREAFTFVSNARYFFAFFHALALAIQRDTSPTEPPVRP